MDTLAKKGKERAIFISISLLLTSIHIFYFNYEFIPDFDKWELIDELIRLSILALLLFFNYQGRNWAKYLVVIFLLLATISSFKSLFTLEIPLLKIISSSVIVAVYILGIFHFFFSKNFKAFSSFQKNRRDISK